MILVVFNFCVPGLQKTGLTLHSSHFTDQVTLDSPNTLPSHLLSVSPGLFGKPNR